MAKPGLIMDLKAVHGNIYEVIVKVRLVVPSEQLTDFWKAVLDAQARHATFEDLLAVIDQYVSLEDSSGTYPDYTPHPGDEGE